MHLKLQATSSRLKMKNDLLILNCFNFQIQVIIKSKSKNNDPMKWSAASQPE